MKANFDGVWFPESDEAGIGVAIRNSEGIEMAAMSKKITKQSSVEALELLAARRAAVFTMEVGFHRAVLKGDVAYVIKSLQTSGMGHSLGGHIFKGHSVFS